MTLRWTPPPATPRADRSAARDRRHGPRLPSGLRPLSEIDQEFEVADGYPDIRGWIVAVAGGSVVGSVRDLVVDPEAMIARYVVVELGPQGTDEGLGRTVLIPIAAAEISEGTDTLRIPGLTALQFTDLPDYDRAILDKDYDAGLLRRVGVRAMNEVVEHELEEREHQHREAHREAHPEPPAPPPPPSP